MEAKLNKARQQLADMFLNALQEDKLPWQQPWIQAVPGFGDHHNPVTGTRYHGTNAVMLWAVAADRKYGDPRWCTFKQAQEKGWNIRKGEHGIPIEFWMIYDTKNRKKLTMREAQTILKQEPERANELRPSSSVYTVFNGTQIEGAPELPSQKHVAPVYQSQLLADFSVQYLEFEHITLETGGHAAYRPNEDSIVMPPKESFIGELEYYDVLFHEYAHSTGHPDRLNRNLMASKKGTNAYALEELRAEIAGAFLLSAAGVVATQRVSQNNIAYVQSWATCIKDDPNALFRAIKDADAICDFVCERGKLTLIRAAIMENQKENVPDRQIYGEKNSQVVEDMETENIEYEPER